MSWISIKRIMNKMCVYFSLIQLSVTWVRCIYWFQVTFLRSYIYIYVLQYSKVHLWFKSVYRMCLFIWMISRLKLHVGYHTYQKVWEPHDVTGLWRHKSSTLWTVCTVGTGWVLPFWLSVKVQHKFGFSFKTRYSNNFTNIKMYFS